MNNMGKSYDQSGRNDDELDEINEEEADDD